MGRRRLGFNGRALRSARGNVRRGRFVELVRKFTGVSVCLESVRRHEGGRRPSDEVVEAYAVLTGIPADELRGNA